MAENKPTFHHLNNSQSQRIFWLLEELDIEYNLVLHERLPASDPKRPFRSPPSLVETGPYGQAPLLISGSADGNRYINESSAIATYLIRTFDTEDKFGLRNGDWIRDEILTSLVGVLHRNTYIILMIDFGALKAPGGEGIGPDGGDIRTVLGHVEREFKNGPPGGYFAGEHPGRADILFEWPLTSIKQRKTVDLEKEFPILDAWLTRVHERPAFKRSLEKGNGYDPTVFPKSGREKK
ncbi:hypothetical protein B0O99DRAFT_514891 [Bisporella sp. PMI_857]|nr:hypothetical protein B0O99DRAFT_514891 [Bisporella sp. PMI_857]